MRVAPKRIGILGAFGIGNSGNEGTLEAIVDMVRRVQPNADLTCICNLPDKVHSDHGIPAVPLHSRPTKKRLQSCGHQRACRRLCLATCGSGN